ncbi:hypothetical protein DFH11DRAFT_1545284 [Phellopilus nigrolimitatus]|nr:hypothetical protein DFH11DRAFT_1545284 [Phellopilus nigrolimitatus]
MTLRSLFRSYFYVDVDNFEPTPHRRVLAIAEVQDRIFSFGTKSDNARWARVCRAWQENALDHVWRDMSSLVPLARLLAPLKPLPREPYKPLTWVFSHEIQAKDWKAFEPYAIRVKRLAPFPAEECKLGYLCNIVLAEFCRSRMTSRILPNLSDLSLGSFDTDFSGSGGSDFLLKHLPSFLHEGLKRLEFNLQTLDVGDDEPLVISLLEEISERAPYLISLSIRTTDNIDMGERPSIFSNNTEPLSILFSRLIHLEILKIDRSVLSPRVIHSLSLLKNLKKIEDDNDLPIPWRASHRATSFQKLAVKNAFPQLTHFSLQNDLMISLLLRTPLKIFELYCLLLLFDVFAKSFPRLRSLRIVDCNTNYYQRERNNDNDTSFPITATTLKPISLLTELEVFALDLIHPVHLTADEVVGVFGSLCSLRTLALDPFPMPTDATTFFTLESIPTIMDGFPLLSRLGLYVNTEPSNSDSNHNLFSVQHHAHKLEYLDIGLSPLRESNVISNALSLSGVLHSESDLDCGCSYIDSVDITAGRNWGKVSKLVRYFSKLGLDGRDMIRSEQEELEATRTYLHASKWLFEEQERWLGWQEDSESESILIYAGGTG